MLKSVDILIGFSVIMLVVSLSVTLIIQWIVHLSGMRGKELLKGLTTLLQQIDPKLLTPEHAQEIATRILTSPMLARSGEKLAGVVQREELVKTMLQIAAGAATGAAAAAGAGAATGGGTGAATPSTAPPASTPNAEQALAQALANMGIPDPGKKLDAIRLTAMRLEASHPELATHVREAQAVITEAESQFVAKIHGWFDPTMDRVSQSFTTKSHYWTAGISLLLALFLQIDSFKIVNRLAIDDNLRASLVSMGAKASPPQGTQTLPQDTQNNLAQLQLLATDKLITWPTWPDFWKHWWDAWGGSNLSVFGVLLTAMLLSFGAPFWFNVLGDLLKLRPALASKDDQQRQERETTQTDGTDSPPSP